jgi:hypothetical protein
MNGDDRKGEIAATLLPPFLAVCAVTVILMALFVWLGPGRPDTEVLSARESTPTSPPAASPTPTPPVSSAPATSPPASSLAATTTTPPPSETPVPGRPEVVVLNQSGGNGLASRVADRVRKAGWTVKQTGNFRGTVSTTTVYYPSSLSDDARDLARDLPGDPRVRERFSNLSNTRLTIVLTDDYGS